MGDIKKVSGLSMNEELIQLKKELNYYHSIEMRLHEMFHGDLSLKEYVDILDFALREPGEPSPVNARILTYEDAKAWTEYKEIGTVEECKTAMAYARMAGYL